jgi:fatty acid desaturase
MTESFHQSAKISKEILQNLQKRSNYPALYRFTVLYSLFILNCIWIVNAFHGTWLNIITSQLSFGLICCSMFACEHETVHHTAFKSRILNRVVAFLAGVAHVYPSSLFKELHFTHHRYTHIPGKDPEISLGNKPGPAVLMNLPMYLSWISGIPLLSFKVVMTLAGALGMPEPIRKSLFPFINPKARRVVFFECLFISLIYASIIVLAIKIDFGFWGILVGQIVGHCFLTCFVTAEHNGLPHEGNIMDKTRSTQTNLFVKLMMWNMPYHAEHHAYPAVPFFSLPLLHNELKEELKHQQNGYPNFHLNTLKQLIKK